MLQVLLAVQLAGAIAIGALLHVQYNWSLPAAGASALGVVVLLRVLIFSNNFLLSASAASATPAQFRPGFIGWLRLWLEEFAASMLQTSWYGPLGKARQHVFDSGATPVLLLHGYGANSAYWGALSRRLDDERISHASVDLEPVGGSIDDYVAQVEQAVHDLCAATGVSEVAIVAHSMGGLVARAWLRTRGDARLARLITLGSPHHGTVLAQFGVGVNAMQMRRSRAGEASGWLRALADAETAELRARIVSIYSHQDNIVSPQSSSCLEGARVIAFGGIGHVALGCNRRVLDCVMHELREQLR
jgi:triacylglycerol esterase/lipase EstA (alpha/beta hydrolase family)